MESKIPPTGSEKLLTPMKPQGKEKTDPEKPQECLMAQAKVPSSTDTETVISETPIAKRKTKKTTRKKARPAEKEEQAAASSEIPLRGLHRSQERQLIRELNRSQRFDHSRQKLEQRMKIRDEKIQQISRAKKEAEQKKFEPSITRLNTIFSDLKANPDNYVLWKAARQMAFTLGDAGDYFGAIQYFELYKKHTDFINPSDVMFFAGLHLGIDLFSSTTRTHKLSVTFPSFNPQKAMTTVLSSLKGKKGDGHEWEYTAEQHNIFKPILNALKKIEDSNFDISDELSELNQTESNILYGDMLRSIACMKCIKMNRFDIAKNMAETIQSRDHGFLTYYVLALCAQHKGEHEQAFALYQQEYIKNEPVFKEFAELCLMMNNYEKAIEIYLFAEEYFSINGYPHEAAYYQKIAHHEIYTHEKRLQKRQKEEAKKTEKERVSASVRRTATPEELEQTAKHLTLTEQKPASKTKKKSTVMSADHYFHTINSNIDQFKFSAYPMYDEDEITVQINDALTQHPLDKWILHTAGWWFYEQGEEQRSKELLLLGLKGVLPVKFNYRFPDSIHKEKQLILRIVNIAQDLLKNETIFPDDETSRDIASFLSAYAYHLISQQQFDLASQLRNLADTLDTRRRQKIAQRAQHQAAIQVVPPELFESLKTH